MSSSSDNVMARFLFAILQQKNLKDIDWNQVARNPILAQEITNGHAARMRYSRFKAALLGIQPQRRNRGDGTSSKSRVSKKKKDDDVKPKKEEEDEKDKKSSGSGIGNIKTEKIKTEANTTPTVKPERRSIIDLSGIPSQPAAPTATTPVLVKAEPGPIDTASQQPLHRLSGPSTTSPVIKPEKPAASSSANTTTPQVPEPSPFGVVSSTPVPDSAASTPYIDGHYIDALHRAQLRLLTPCSESDGVSGMQDCFLSHSQGPSASELLHSQHHHHHPHTIGAGSPALTIATSAAPSPYTAPSPYEFSQCAGVVDPPVCPSPGPWYAQQHQNHHQQMIHGHQHPHLHHQQYQNQQQHQPNGQPHPALFYTPGSAIPTVGGAGGGGPYGYLLDHLSTTPVSGNGYSPPLFCDHHHPQPQHQQHNHSQPLQQQQQNQPSQHNHHHSFPPPNNASCCGDHHHEQANANAQPQHPATHHYVRSNTDPLGLHYPPAAADNGSSGALGPAATSQFRERELELEMAARAGSVDGSRDNGGGSGGSVGVGSGAGTVKLEWEDGEGEVDGI